MPLEPAVPAVEVIPPDIDIDSCAQLLRHSAPELGFF